MARILILDSDGFVRKTAALFFEANGYDVVSTSTYVDFDKLLEYEKPDLALVDLRMPGITGDELVKNTRRRLGDRCCPLVFWSSRSPQEQEALVRSSGAAGFICKTWSSAEILARIREFFSEEARERRQGA